MVEHGEALLEIGRIAASRGMMPATSGNLSVRLDGDAVLITASGVDKGALSLSDLVCVDRRGVPAAGAPPTSAETALHLARYDADLRVGAVVHVHADAAVLASRRFVSVVPLEGFELCKALAGVTSHTELVEVPVFENDQDVPRLARAVEARLATLPRCWGYLLRGHGLYAWGRHPAEAWRHTEALVTLCGYAWREWA